MKSSENVIGNNESKITNILDFVICFVEVVLSKVAYVLGVLSIVFWGLEFGVNEKSHPWFEFNLDNPCIMAIGLLCVIYVVYRFFKKKR